VAAGRGLLPAGLHISQRLADGWDVGDNNAFHPSTLGTGRTGSHHVDQSGGFLRRENGQWKVVLRHADELPRKDEQQLWPATPAELAAAANV
jgi:hypothetical protein